MDVEMKKPFNFAFKIMKFYGIWINDEATLSYKIRGITTFLFLPVLFWILLFVGTCQREVSLEMAYSITFIIANAFTIIRVIDFVPKIQFMTNLFNSIDGIMSKFVKNDKRVVAKLKFYLKVFATSFGFTFGGVIMAFTMSFIDHKFPYPIADPFKFLETEIGFIFMNSYGMIALLFIAPMYVCLGWYPMFFICFIVGFMEDFNEKLEEFGKIDTKNDERDEIQAKELIELIQAHETIKEFVEEISRIFKLTFFLNAIAGSVILCTALFVMPLVS